MALKLEFSASFKDAEQTLKILNQLNAETKKIAQSSGEVGIEGKRAFEELGKSIQGFSTTSKSIDDLSKLSGQIKTLTSSKTELSSFANSFTELGKSMRQGLGLATDTLVTQFQSSLKKIKDEADDTAKKLKDSLATLHDPKSTDAQRQTAKLDAGVYSVELANQRARISEQERNYSMSAPRGWLGGASVAGSLKMASGVAGGVAMAAQTYETFNKLPLVFARGDLAQQNILRDARERVAEGDITSAALRSRGIGHESEYEGSMFQGYMKHFSGATALLAQTAAGTAIGAAAGGVPGAIIGGITGFAGGLATYKSSEQREAEHRMELRSLDTEKFEAAMNPGWRRQRNAYEQNRNLFFQEGDTSIMSTLEVMNKQGVRDARVLPIMDMMARHGQSLGGQYTGNTYDKDGKLIRGQATTFRSGIYKIQQDLNLSEKAVEMMVKQGNTDTQTESLRYALGASGATNRYAMGQMADVYANMADKSATGQANMGGIYAMSNVGMQAVMNFNPKISQTEAATVTGEATQKVSQMIGSNQSLLGSSIEYQLIKMGVQSPMSRALIKQAMAAGDTAKANRLISKMTGKSEEDISKTMGDTRSRVMDTMKAAFQIPEAEAKAFESEKIDYMSGNYKQAQLGGFKAMEAVVTGQVKTADGKILDGREQGKRAGIEGEGPEGLKEETSKAQIQGAQELETLRTTVDKLGISISSIISESFRGMADKIMSNAKSLEQSDKENKKPAIERTQMYKFGTSR